MSVLKLMPCGALAKRPATQTFHLKFTPRGARPKTAKSWWHTAQLDQRQRLNTIRRKPMPPGASAKRTETQRMHRELKTHVRCQRETKLKQCIAK